MKRLIDRLKTAEFKTIQLEGKRIEVTMIHLSRPERDAVIAAVQAYHQLPPESC